MYDINRSNLLSVESMKMYLYDLAVLGNAETNIQNRINVLRNSRNGLGKVGTFNEDQYREEEHDYKAYILKYLGSLVIVCILLLIFIFFAAILGALPDVPDNTFSLLLVVLVILAIPIIPVIMQVRNVNRNNEMKRYQKIEARTQFQIADDERVQREKKQIESISKDIRVLQDRLSSIKNEIQRLFDLDILHKSYRDVRICGIMFQLFDTGRVYNLTDAMNLYEDLKWKAEMKAMLQALMNKVDELICIQRNIEYYSKCTLENQIETNRLLDDVSMNQKQIQSNQDAILMNSDVIRSNTSTMRMLAEFDFINTSRY